MFNQRRVTALAALLVLSLLKLPSALADVYWQAHCPSPKAGTLNQILVNSNGVMVASYQFSPGLAVSTNGTNWTWERTANPLMAVGSIAYGNGKWVITTPSTNTTL